MKHDIIRILKKHIAELDEILDKYHVTNKYTLINMSEKDMVFQKAVLMSAGYIGELSKKLDERIIDSYPDVNWRRLRTSRNIIFHDYDIVDMEIIASVIFTDIKDLKEIID